jgi:hypothetical protein
MTTTTTEPNITCDCGRHWHVVPSIRKAHNGQRGDRRRVKVPTHDTYGNVTGYAFRDSDRWISEGPSVAVTTVQTDAETIYRWKCACAATLSYVTTRLYWVACTYGHGGQDSYADRHAVQFACPCCGHAKGHWVTHDTPAPCAK